MHKKRVSGSVKRDCGVDTSDLPRKPVHQITYKKLHRINTDFQDVDFPSPETTSSSVSSLSSLSVSTPATSSYGSETEISLYKTVKVNSKKEKGHDTGGRPLEIKPISSPGEGLRRKGTLQYKPIVGSNNIPPANSASKPNTRDTTSPIVIAHDKDVQALLDHYRIAKGVQFEIARGVTEGRWKWSDITKSVLRDLRGTNFEAGSKLSEAIGKGSEILSPIVLAARRNTFKELDREHDALMEGKQRGLGLMGNWKGEENWYGGRIQLIAKVSINRNKSGRNMFSFRLEPYGIGKSNRATRYCTSLSILQLKIEKNSEYALSNDASIANLLGERFVLCGRVYCPFHTKEGKLFLVETNEDYERKPVSKLGDKFRQSFDDFINWHNPMELNSDQALSKWLARWALILSTSRPVIQFDPENIFMVIDDEYSSTGEVMTDGCGFINGSALRIIATQTNSSLPSAIQGRFAGAKGVWYLHPDEKHQNSLEPPMIWIRKSQLKVKHGDKTRWDRSLLIFDIVRLTRLTVPSSLYMQTILNMSYNGVKTEVFETVLEKGLTEEIGTLMEWKGSNAQAKLIEAVERIGGLRGARLSRSAGADARLYGYIFDEVERDEEDDGNSLVDRDPNSGRPITQYESTREMLLAGFSPFESPILRDKLRHILSDVVNNFLEMFRLPVALSVEAFIIPDPYGVLEEGEIYFRSSKEIDNPTISTDPNTFRGPVLATRNPTRVASDVRKVVAVHHDKLLSYKDVIVFSIKGKRSLASYLGGGDYDGDTVSIIADQAIVNGFTNSGDVFEPDEIRKCFEEEVEKVTSFLQRMEDKTPVHRHREIFKKITAGLATGGKVGLYSHFHDNAVYSIGYDHPDTVRLAYMFTTCLDSIKTGLRVQPEIFALDSRKWNRPRPYSMQKMDESDRNENRAELPFKRPKALGSFVLDSIKERGEQLKNQIFSNYRVLCKEAEDPQNSLGTSSDLSIRYREALLWATKVKEDGCKGYFDQIKKIEGFVSDLLDDFVKEAGSIIRERRGGNVPTLSKTFSQLCRQYSEKFNEETDILLISKDYTKEVAASYAYMQCHKSTSWVYQTFPFTVAFSTLCALRAKASPTGCVSMTTEASDYCLLSSSLVRASANSSEGGEEH